MLESGGDGVAEECEDAAVLLAAFAGTALFLSSVGIYAVTRYIASRRIQEFGIRMALGAKHSDILKLMLRRGLMPVLLGTGVGLAGMLAASRVLSSSSLD